MATLLGLGDFNITTAEIANNVNISSPEGNRQLLKPHEEKPKTL